MIWGIYPASAFSRRGEEERMTCEHTADKRCFESSTRQPTTAKQPGLHLPLSLHAPVHSTDARAQRSHQERLPVRGMWQSDARSRLPLPESQAPRGPTAALPESWARWPSEDHTHACPPPALRPRSWRRVCGWHCQLEAREGTGATASLRAVAGGGEEERPGRGDRGWELLNGRALRSWPAMVQRPWGSHLLRHRKAQLLLVNLLAFGLEVCLAAGITYVPPLLLEVGVEEKFMTMVLGIGPVLGLVSVPLLGSASDHWRGRYGRRRPFIWALSLGVLLSLFLIPRAGWLAGLLCSDARALELALLILGVGLLDFCGQVCFTPLEALLSDLFRDPDHCRQAFSVYAFMISLGGCLGYLLPAIDWDASALAPYLGTQEECLFGLLTLIFLACVAATLFVAEEAAPGPAEPAEGLSAAPPRSRCCPCRARLAVRSVGALLPRLHQLCCRAPRPLRRLFVAELCSWTALMTFTLFYTDFVGEGLYQGVPRAEPGTEARRHYDEGVRMGSLGLFLQCTISLLFSLVMDRLVQRFGTRAVYLASVVAFPVAAGATCLSRNMAVVTASAALTGFTFSALQILPYTLASLYHREKQVPALATGWNRGGRLGGAQKLEKAWFLGGVRMGSLGLFLQCTISLLFSLVMDRLLQASARGQAPGLPLPGLARAHAVVPRSSLAAPTDERRRCWAFRVRLAHRSARPRDEGRPFSAGVPLHTAVLTRFPPHPQVFLPKYRGDSGGGPSEDSLVTSFCPGPKAGSPFPSGHTSAGGSLLPAPPALCGASACDVSMRVVVGEPPEARVVPGRGICLDLAILDSAFLLSQVAPSLLMGSIVQLSQSVTAYMVSAAGLGLVAIYFATQVVFDKSDLSRYSV
ncbi:Solute carrier family 45 member 3 [Galemys pyrenaicus]|uniref:Solute carrier family 45 member 3 n=1 Tax=Galemys pyrenaicus TaxID=202257 RepID=A0A8J6DQI3_GALPY|nr:Solute carrier family 45 member 3 [Galemys pyrenaicus]